jgi:hypothetical protein
MKTPEGSKAGTTFVVVFINDFKTSKGNAK